MLSGRVEVGGGGDLEGEEILERMDSLLATGRGLKGMMHLEDRGYPPLIWTISFCPSWGLISDIAYCHTCRTGIVRSALKHPNGPQDRSLEPLHSGCMTRDCHGQFVLL